MKKIALLCFTVLGFFTAKAQLEWAPVGAKYYYETWWDTGVSGGSGTTVVEVIGDTVVQGKTCRYLQKSSGYIYWPIPCQGYQITYEEDGRIYFFDELAQSFTLFYDFNKAPGEIWEVPFCHEDGACDNYSLFFQLDSITYTELNEIQVKTQHLKYRVNWSEEWNAGIIIYEGIGNTPFLHFQPTLCLVAEEGIIRLSCYESPTTGTINFIGGDPCNLNTPTEDPVSLAARLQLSPNPVSNELVLRFTPQLSGRVQVRVFDARGQLVQAIHKELANASTSLSATNWPAGMYVLQCIKDGEVLGTEKFVKQ